MKSRRVQSVLTFQSTLPARGATPSAGKPDRLIRISIHAPCTGSDLLFSGRAPVLIYFNPRSLHGERRRFSECVSLLHLFQSTLPARGATAQRIHRMLTATHFNPRSLHGERLGDFQRMLSEH